MLPTLLGRSRTGTAEAGSTFTRDRGLQWADSVGWFAPERPLSRPKCSAGPRLRTRRYNRSAIACQHPYCTREAYQARTTKDAGQPDPQHKRVQPPGRIP